MVKNDMSSVAASREWGFPVEGIPPSWRRVRGLYAITADCADYPIKIGRVTSSSVRLRMRAIQTACPYRVLLLAFAPGAQRAEKGVHAYLAGDRLNGEWFRRSALVESIVAEISDGTVGRFAEMDSPVMRPKICNAHLWATAPDEAQVVDGSKGVAEEDRLRILDEIDQERAERLGFRPLSVAEAFGERFGLPGHLFAAIPGEQEYAQDD